MASETVQQILESAGDPAYSVDEHGHISGWNAPAQRLLGHSRDAVVGQPCHEIVQGLDVFGNRYCKTGCPLLLMARQCTPIRHFEMDVQMANSALLRVLCFAFKVPDAKIHAYSLVHLLRPANQPVPHSLEQGEDDLSRLTQRELIVLRLLAGGHTTAEMAAILTISTSTVRKHIQHILEKLDVHSRLAAVSAAFEKRIL